MISIDEIKQRIRDASKDIPKEDQKTIDSGLGFIQKWELKLLMKLGAIVKLEKMSGIDYGYAINSDYPILKVNRRGDDDYIDCDGDIRQLQEKMGEYKSKFNSGGKIVYVPRVYVLYQKAKKELIYGRAKAQEYHDESMEQLIDNTDAELEANAYP